MKKDQVNIRLEGDVLEGAEIKVNFSDEAKNRIPRVGDEIFLISPYPVDDEDDEFTAKEKPVMGYSYTGVMVKSTVLSDDCEEVLVNGDFKLSVNKPVSESNKKLIVCAHEEEAKDKYVSLMNASIERANGYFRRAKDILDSLEESKAKMHH